MHDLARRLKERRLVQWALAYLGGAWLVLQVASLVGAHFAWPAALLRALTVLLAVGFLAALVIGWYHGEKGRQRVSGAELLMLAALLVIAASAIALVNAPRMGARSAAADTLTPQRAVPDHEPSGSVAVLPFDDLAGGEGDYFSQGITDEIISELTKIEGLKVISRTSVFALRGSGLTLPQIADTLGVRHVLEGSVRRSGARVRVIAQLIDPQTDTQLWAETFERDLTDIFAVQEEIARQVSSSLVRRVAGLRPRGAGSRTQPAAYDAYLRGAFARNQHTREGLVEATTAYEEAIRADPSFAPAYAGLASAHALWALFGYRGGPDAFTRIALALEAAGKAVELDPALPEAYAMRAHARLRAWMPADSVLGDLQQAVRLAPSSGEIRMLYALGLAYGGRFDRALDEVAAAAELAPLTPGVHDVRSVLLSVNRRYEEALHSARLARSLEPRFPSPRRQEARALLLLGRFEECSAMDVRPYLAFRAMCLHSAGATREAQAIIDSLSAAVDSYAPDLPLVPGVFASDIAEYYAWVGDSERTLHWFSRSAETSTLLSFLYTETALYDRVRANRRFGPELDRIRRSIRSRVERERS